MRRRLPLLALLLVAAAAAAFSPRPREAERFWTDREDALALTLPGQGDAFTFAVFGDRTGGPNSGVAVLRAAVQEVNLLGPDLVMTVGDLIQGYDQERVWLRQMREYRGIMDQLTSPWFPVAGNHDVYWRGPEGQRPVGEHESNYEKHFGPLWYAFRHKDCAFVVLYTDEGGPDGRAKTFNDPESQRMSAEQLAWLDGTLSDLGDARHVFVFLHHPRWLGGNYGNDWERVHSRLAEARNVRAVFAGHIHRMRYDGVRDGIEYFTLATVGGHQSGLVPDAGWMHHYMYVTVRGDGIDVVSYPVGSADDPRSITGELADESLRTARALAAGFSSPIRLLSHGGASAITTIELENPSVHPLTLVLSLRTTDARWSLGWEAKTLRLHPGEKRSVTLTIGRPGGELDADARLVHLDLDAVLRSPAGQEIRIPTISRPLPFDLSDVLSPWPKAGGQALRLYAGGHVRVPHEDLYLPDGPFTVEGFVKPSRFEQRQGLFQKTEGAEFGLSLNDGAPSFAVHLDGEYVRARAEGRKLRIEQWSHLAGVFDGKELRLYVDGDLVASTPASGTRTRGDIPLLIGGEPTSRGDVIETFAGAVDEVRVSTTARYEGERFEPSLRHQQDDQTVLLLHMDEQLGPWLWDSSPFRAHPTWSGQVSLTDPAQ